MTDTITLAQASLVVATHVKVDLEEMQQRLNASQQRAMIDGIGEILKASPEQPANPPRKRE